MTAATRLWSVTYAWALISSLLLATFSLLGHGSLDVQIAQVTGEIAKTPGNPTLYLRRGDLHRLHQDWTNALADFQHAEQLSPKLAQVYLCRGRLWLDAGEPGQAIAALDRFLQLVPDEPEGLITRARARMKLNEPVAAADDYTRALAKNSPQPDHYLERANAQSAAGRLAEAVTGLDEGMKQLGPLVALQLRAVELEVAQTNYPAALARVDLMLARLPRKDHWLFRKGEILRAADREAEAHATFQQARDSLDALPVSIQNLPANRELAGRIAQALEPKSNITNKEERP